MHTSDEEAGRAGTRPGEQLPLFPGEHHAPAIPARQPGETQEQWAARTLAERGFIGTKEAWARGCRRLAARVHELRKAGVSILTAHRADGPCAVYRIDEGGADG